MQEEKGIINTCMILETIIPWLFYVVFFVIPLIFLPFTSELFEFNKMVSVYLLTTLIVAAWLVKMIYKKKIIFRRTILDIPLVIFLLSQIISTFLSIDFHTSLLGYYSRFNGGLLSSLSYSLLYWAFVSNMDKEKTMKVIYSGVAASIISSLYGVLEHFGIDKNLWVQDVVNRVFSTFGQPNWLAAWLVALIPLTWMKIKNYKEKSSLIFLGISILFFITLLFTKSRSGIPAFFFAYLIFWGGSLFLKKEKIKKELTPFIVVSSSILLAIFIFGTPWTPSLEQLVLRKQAISNPSGPALETGGTESWEIRKIVWKGAIEIWKHNLLFGTGPETFAYSYYNVRPVEHNLVSEWDFLYNKAHNEYLNFAANTGSLGLASYLALIGFMAWQILKPKEGKPKTRLALFSGFSSLLIANFFGFSVVPTQLLLFLFPAFAVTLGLKTKTQEQKIALTRGQKVFISLVVFLSLYTLFLIARYWYSDYLYAKGKSLNDKGEVVKGRMFETQAISLSPNEAVFWDELSQSDTAISVALSENKEKDKASEFAKVAISESDRAISLSPKNLNLKRNRASMFIKLSALEANYLLGAKKVLEEALLLAPTDAKLSYNLGLIEAKLGDNDTAISTLERTIELKTNYKDARLALAILLIRKGEKAKAKEELIYILEKIDPNDTVARGQLEEIGR